MTWWIKGLIAIAIIAAASTAVLTYNRAIARAEKAEQDIAEVRLAHKEQLNENVGLRMRMAQVDALLAARRAERDTAGNIERKIDAKLASIVTKSPEARKWAAEPVPADLLAGLRDDGAADRRQDAEGSTADGADAPGAGAGVAGDDDERGAPRLRPQPAPPGPRL